MKNKILVNVYVPSIDEKYEIYIPTNESIKKIVELITKSVYELSDSNINLDSQHYLLDPDSSQMFALNSIVRDTCIKCEKNLILI